MTRRERLEVKLEKREQWADSRKSASTAAFAKADDIMSMIPLGQPILIGHHSEKRARRDHEKIDAYIGKSVANQNMAVYHQEKAAGLAAQLESTIFSDDENAVETLEAKIAKLESQQETMKNVNRICRMKNLSDAEKTAQMQAECPNLTEKTIAGLLHPAESWQSVGYPSFALTNNSANIRRCKERLAGIKAQNARKELAEQSASGVVISGRDYVAVTFAEKPEREIINALKAAGFRWCGGGWRGRRENIPAEITAMIQ